MTLTGKSEKVVKAAASLAYGYCCRKGRRRGKQTGKVTVSPANRMLEVLDSVMRHN